MTKFMAFAGAGARAFLPNSNATIKMRAWLIALLLFGHDRINLSPDERGKMNRRRMRPSPKYYTSGGECARSLTLAAAARGPRSGEKEKDSFTDSPCPQQWRLYTNVCAAHSLTLQFASMIRISNRNKYESLLAFAFAYHYFTHYVNSSNRIRLLPKRLAPLMTI